MITFPAKDKDEELDYTLDWSLRITTDPIDSSTWSTPTLVGSSLATSGLTLATSSIATYGLSTCRTIVWLTGGITGSVYKFTNRITTAGGRVMDQTCKLKIKDK